MCETSSRAYKNTRRSAFAERAAGLVCVAIAVCVALFPAQRGWAEQSRDALSLEEILAAHLHALHLLHVSLPHTLQTEGTLDGLGVSGAFRTWREGENERDDETLGIRVERTLRIGGDEYVQNANGDVRVLRGLMARRQLTEDFIDSGDFARHPEDDALLGRGTLDDGRAVWRLRVTPPGGEPYGVALDAKTWLVDEKSYPDGDAVATLDYDDYRVLDGALVPFEEVDSSGDHRFDLHLAVEKVDVNEPIEASVFAPFQSTVIDASAPITVRLLSDKGHLFVRAAVGGKAMTFLIDSGSQAIVLDPSAAKALGLVAQGRVEIRGAERTSGAGFANLDDVDIGGARLPVGVVSVVDLSAVQYLGIPVDGVLGYPLFAAAEVRIDPDALTMTLARPGSLPSLGSSIPVDTDRELPEIAASVGGIDGRFLADTGNNSELLLFHRFVQAHPRVAQYVGHGFVPNSGVGGSSSAVPVMVDRLAIGPFTLYNRYSNVILSDTGAFADRNDAGNIGWGSLRNFVVTFDLANGRLQLERARAFDDGRYRFGREQ
jgi:Aspartyl protease